jgi:hypothetical protein
VTTIVATLFALFGSATALVTAAWLAGVPTLVGETVIVTVALTPEVSVPSEQFTTLVPVHDPCVATAEMNVRPAGSGSESTTPLAASGPAFATVSV